MRKCILLLLMVVISSGLLSQFAFAFDLQDFEKSLNFKSSGDECLRKGNISLAIEKYNQAVELNPQLASAYFNLAIAYFSEQNLPKAAELLEIFLRLKPDDVEALYNLGFLKVYQGKFEEASEYFKKSEKCCTSSHNFFPLIKQGLKFVEELSMLDSRSQALALFSLQMEQGLAPTAVSL